MLFKIFIIFGFSLMLNLMETVPIKIFDLD